MAALCVECRKNRVHERGVKRCSDCEAAFEHRVLTPASQTASATAAGITPGSLLGVGVAMQFFGGLLMGLTLNGDGLAGLFFVGIVIAWAGGMALMVALIAFGVRIGIQSATPTKLSL